jgi:hypothetical protein
MAGTWFRGHVDWMCTKSYALGLGSTCVNLVESATGERPARRLFRRMLFRYRRLDVRNPGMVHILPTLPQMPGLDRPDGRHGRSLLHESVRENR